MISQELHSLQSFVERNTTLAIQKAIALQIVGAGMTAEMGITESCKLASKATGFCWKVIHRWAADIYVDFFSLISSIDESTDERIQHELESGRGKHPKWASLTFDENFMAEVRKFVCDTANMRGRPNLTLNDIVGWLKDHHQVDVCKSTVSIWLHELGFSYQHHSKGIYFDGHERSDVVADRKLYLNRLKSLESRMWTYNSPSPDPAIRPVIRVFHDESTFYANADQSSHWTDGTKQVLKQKSLGQAIMVSDFVEEVGGMLESNNERCTIFLEHKTDGYFTNDHLISQV